MITYNKMIKEEQEEETDIASQLASKIEIKPKMKEEFIPVKKSKQKKQKETVERTKKFNNNIVY